MASLNFPRLPAPWRRRIYRYRRLIAAGLAALAVLLVATSLTEARDAPVGGALARPTPAPGLVAVPVTLADAAMTDWLQPDDVIDVVAASGNGQTATTARIVAEGVRILEIPNGDGGTFARSATGAIVVIEADQQTALELAAAQADAALSAILRT